MTGVKMGMACLAVGILFFPYLTLAALDSDTDGLSDDQEQRFGTSPMLMDTDGDGFGDGEEVKNGFSPLGGNKKKFDVLDTDKDGVQDWIEQWFGSDIEKSDTDGDGFSDYDEIMFGFSPVSLATEKMERNIVVDLTKQQMRYMVDGLSVQLFPVSTGNPATPTPVGDYAVRRKVPVIRYTGVGYDFKGVKWNMEFLPHYYLHTAYWHNDFGKRTRSHGCVNMRESDAGFLYKYIDVGMPVSVVGVTPAHLFVGK